MYSVINTIHGAIFRNKEIAFYPDMFLTHFETISKYCTETRDILPTWKDFIVFDMVLEGIYQCGSFKHHIDIKLDVWSNTWFDDEAKALLNVKATEALNKIIVNNARDRLDGGRWILVDGARVSSIQGCRIFGIYEGAKVGKIQGGSYVKDIACNASVDDICDISMVSTLWGGAIVKNIRDSSCVSEIHGARVGTISGWSRVGTIYSDSNIGVICDHAKVISVQGGFTTTSWEKLSDGTWNGKSNVYPPTRIGSIRDHVEIDNIYGKTEIGTICSGVHIADIRKNVHINKIESGAKIGSLSDKTCVFEDLRVKEVVA